MEDQRFARAVFTLLLLVSAVFLVQSYTASATQQSITAFQEQSELEPDERTPVVGERDNKTVATGRGGGAPHALYVFAEDGTLEYYEERSKYADVDPSPEGEHTLLVAADERANESDCSRKCSWQHIRQINISTGEKTDVYQLSTPSDRDSNWHDVDRVSSDQYLVAGIWHDEVYRLNTTTGVREWSWSGQADYPLDGGGPYPEDWMHMNDVEKLPDGRVMASPRNQDQVIFIHPEKGLQEDWTLGCDDCFDTLYEQHNPDYIPESQGGPAVLVADSENNRIVEYQRVDGEWEQSWVWQDERMDWPRDADRLPNGHTLITDTHENRVIEVNRDGEIVWTAGVPNGYEAERLGTGDESSGGPSAASANLTSVTSERTTSAAFGLANEGERTGISRLLHGLYFVLPAWMGVTELLFVIMIGALVLVWAALELSWQGVSVRLPVSYERGGEQ